MTSIKQNPASLPLPDFRNFGVMLRVLLGVNFLALAAALFRPEAVAGPAVIVVASGGNVDVALHRKAMERFGAA